MTGPAQCCCVFCFFFTYEIERWFTHFESLREAMEKCQVDGELEPLPPKRGLKLNKATIDERIESFSRLLRPCQRLADVESGPLLEFFFVFLFFLVLK